jgi:hypothetical protein
MISWIGVLRKVSSCFGAFQSIENDALADFAAPDELVADRIRLRRTRRRTLHSQASRRVSFVAAIRDLR